VGDDEIRSIDISQQFFEVIFSAYYVFSNTASSTTAGIAATNNSPTNAKNTILRIKRRTTLQNCCLEIEYNIVSTKEYLRIGIYEKMRESQLRFGFDDSSI
jgi:hypothetical protein